MSDTKNEPLGTQCPLCPYMYIKSHGAICVVDEFGTVKTLRMKPWDYVAGCKNGIFSSAPIKEKQMQHWNVWTEQCSYTLRIDPKVRAPAGHSVTSITRGDIKLEKNGQEWTVTRPGHSDVLLGIFSRATEFDDYALFELYNRDIIGNAINKHMMIKFDSFEQTDLPTGRVVTSSIDGVLIASNARTSNRGFHHRFFSPCGVELFSFDNTFGCLAYPLPHSPRYRRAVTEVLRQLIHVDERLLLLIVDY